MAFSLTVQPTVDNSTILVNPDIGVVDYNTINFHDNKWWNDPTYPVTSVCYWRWYWEELEPTEGDYKWDVIDNVFNEAAALGKKVVLRIMTLGGNNETYWGNHPLYPNQKIYGSPKWIRDQVKTQKPTPDVVDPKGPSYTVPEGDWCPDYKDPIFLAKLTTFMNALADRYRDKENLLRVDIGLVGTWGEWHLTEHVTSYDSLIVNGYKVADMRPYINLVRTNFPRHFSIINLGPYGDPFQAFAMIRDCGWRIDSLGDWSPIGAEGFTHMGDQYPRRFTELDTGELDRGGQQPDFGFSERWKTVPVDMEIAYILKTWATDSNYDDAKISQSFKFMLENHCSLLNLKSENVPAKVKPYLDLAMVKLGYRFALTELQVDNALGRSITIRSEWQNNGCAPSYYNYPVVYRLVNDKGEPAAFFETHVDITKWMPTDSINDTAPIYELRDTFAIPDGLEKGTYHLEVGMVKPKTYEAAITLANKGKVTDKWLSVCELTFG